MIVARVLAVAAGAYLLASCGGDVDVCSRPGGECPPPKDFNVDFAVLGAGKYGALQLDVTHLGDSGGFIGRGDHVDCVALVDAIAASNYLGERTVKIGLISLEGITTPAAVMRCGFRTSDELAPSDFDIEVTDASDTTSMQVEPPPTVVVQSITER